MKLEEQLKQYMKENNVIIVRVIHRPSEGYYNYKLKQIWVYYKTTKYEEPDKIRDMVVYTGAFQEYTLEEVERTLEKLGFEKIFEI